MKVRYDPEVDVLTIVLSDAPIAESDEGKPGLILDYDIHGNVVGLEIAIQVKAVRLRAAGHTQWVNALA